MNYVLKSGGMTYTVASLGAEIISVKDAIGNELIWCADKSVWGNHAPLLFPVCGRIKNSRYKHEGKWYDMGIHGFLRYLDFELVEKDEGSVALIAKSNDETRATYPFDFSVAATYKAENCKLMCTYRIKNESNMPMPYAFGLHPGFNLFGDISDYKIIFDRENVEQKRTSADGLSDILVPRHLEGCALPVDENEIYPIDTIILKYPGTTARLVSEASAHEISMEYSDNFGFFCIWKAPKPEAKYLCLEPWTTVPSKSESEEIFKTRPNIMTLPVGKEEVFRASFTFIKN